jgi:hypothetical protein
VWDERVREERLQGNGKVGIFLIYYFIHFAIVSVRVTLFLKTIFFYELR